jgi:hypothetical protein
MRTRKITAVIITVVLRDDFFCSVLGSGALAVTLLLGGLLANSIRLLVN